MYHKYVRAPIETEGIRLDTVLRSLNGDFVYAYTQSIATRPKLRKVDIVLGGDIYESDRKLYEMERTEPLSFYISSMSTLLDPSERYMTRIVERRAAANTACYVEFEQGKAEVKANLGYNQEELSRIRGNILEVLENQNFDLDSIVIAASASPEGTLAHNNALSTQRAAAVAAYFEKDIRHYRDSVRRSGFTLTVGADGRERVGQLGIHLEISDWDQRESALQKEPFYRHLREKLYPRLRTVKFDFFLHRKGMIKDTVHTTELDSTYMRGIALLKEREYEKALECLRPYRDYIGYVHPPGAGSYPGRQLYAGGPVCPSQRRRTGRPMLLGCLPRRPLLHLPGQPGPGNLYPHPTLWPQPRGRSV